MTCVSHSRMGQSNSSSVTFTSPLREASIFYFNQRLEYDFLLISTCILKATPTMIHLVIGLDLFLGSHINMVV